MGYEPKPLQYSGEGHYSYPGLNKPTEILRQRAESDQSASVVQVDLEPGKQYP
jgi:hypothetical protein